MTTPKPKLRWFQYRLRTLLIVVTLCAIPFAWVAAKWLQLKREQEAARAFETLGGLVNWSKPSGPVWLRDLIGDDLFTHIELLYLFGTEVTDTGLENIKGLGELQTLNLWATKITDTGLENLKGLSQLRTLDLGETKITDAGLEHFKGLSQLQTLNLVGTNVTRYGAREPQGIRPTQRIASSQHPGHG